MAAAPPRQQRRQPDTDQQQQQQQQPPPWPGGGQASGGDAPQQQQRPRQPHAGGGGGGASWAGSSPPGGGGQRSSGGGGRRYGPWPGTAGSPADGRGPRPPGNRSQGGARSFSWPSYMDAPALQAGMKRGSIFRARFRVNASNRGEGFCTLEGLPSDLLVRGEINQNRAVEGDEVAVAPFKLADWFCVYRERDKLAELGLLPQGAADPLTASERLSQMALDANEPGALAAAQSPWLAAGSPAGALHKLAELLQARTDMRVTGRVVSVLQPSPRRDAVVGVLLPVPVALGAASPGGGASSGAAPSPPAAAAAAALATGSFADCLMLFPLDPRLPKCLLPPDTVAGLPPELRDEASSEDLESRTFVTGAITAWPAGSPFPLAEVRASLGPSGDIEAGTKALLAAEHVCEEDFGLEAYACLPRLPWRISDAEASCRADFTKWRVFSIDPVTARDLDDALSIQPLAGGRWRVGVHIADVATFVRPDTALDDEAQRRGSSVYLVQRVIPMLPRLLCEQLCSLQPGEPRLAFSIVWELDDDGTIQREWAGRSVIDSCAKLGYPQVQQMIEGCFDPAVQQTQLYHGVTWDQVTFDCLALHGIASRLRAARFAAGALRLNNTRLCFALDAEGRPAAAAPYVTAEANHLVEEYMLLANMRVAARIAAAFPRHALLRRHPPPNARKMTELTEAAALLGVRINTGSAAALAASLKALREACPDDATREVLMLLAIKPMQLAEYFCTGQATQPAAWRHYALAVGLYTHFTSPIRRYPDIIVHRLLAAALELEAEQGKPSHADLLTAPVAPRAQPPAPVDAAAAAPSPAAAAAARQREALPGDGDDDDGGGGGGSADEGAPAPAAAAALVRHGLPDVPTLVRVAKHSNDTKLSARSVSDGSLRLHLCVMLDRAPVVTWAVAESLGGDRYFTAYLPEFGCEVKLQLSDMGVPLTGAWDEASRTLTISEAPQQQQQQQQQQQLGEPPDQQQRRRRPELLLDDPAFDLRAWLDSVGGRLLNPQRIPQAQLPLEVRVFTRFPVVVGSYRSRMTCHPEDIAAKLWLRCGAAGEAAGLAVAAAAPPPGAVMESVMAEALAED